MFTGIIETTGKVLSNSEGKLVIQTGLAEQLKTGSSIAVNGICLTATELEKDQFSADYMPETSNKTTIGGWKEGYDLNLELAMQANGRFEGHIVSGHIDGVGTITKISEDGNAHLVTIDLPSGLEKYVVQKGSITINGISLTVASVEQSEVTVSIIPHTWAVTNFHTQEEGCKLNVEVDMMAKYAEKLMK